MFKKRIYKAKNTRNNTGAKRLFVLRAFAEENPTESSPAGNGGVDNIAQLIATARKEEKDKLYPRITELENKLKSYAQQEKEYLTRIATLTKELDEVKKNSDTSDKDKQIADLTQKLSAAQEQLKNAPTAESIREEVKAEYDLKYYADGLVRDNKAKLLSPYIPNITGKNKEEIDSALQKAIEDSTALKKELGIDDTQTSKKKKGKGGEEEEDNGGSKRPPKQKHTSLADSEEFEYTMEEIQALDPTSPEYAEFRKKLGLK